MDTDHRGIPTLPSYNVYRANCTDKLPIDVNDLRLLHRTLYGEMGVQIDLSIVPNSHCDVCKRET